MRIFQPKNLVALTLLLGGFFGVVAGIHAYPAVETTSGGTQESNTTASPITLPSGVQTGDLLMVFFSKDGTAAPTSITGSGWSTLSGTASAGSYQIAYWKIANGTDSLTVNHASERTAHVSYRITGHATSTAPEQGTAASGDSVNPDSPSLTTSWSGEETLWIAVSSWNGNDAFVSYPSSYSLNQANFITSSGLGTAIAVASRNLAATTENPGAFTIDSAQEWAAQTYAVRPGAGGGGGGGSTGGIKIEGVAYGSNGVTPIGAGRTITAAVGTSTPSLHSTTTDASGNFSITGIATTSLGSWSTPTVTNINEWNDIAFGNGLFVAVGGTTTGQVVMTSPDGTTWTSHSAAGNDDFWQAVAFGNGRFVAVADCFTPGYANDCVMYSDDGVTWTTTTSSDDTTDWYAVEYLNGLFVATAQDIDMTCIMTSPDGIDWTTRETCGNEYYWDVTYGEGLYVAVGVSTVGQDRLATSSDGLTWSTSTPTGDAFGWTSVTYGNGRFVAVAGGGDRVMYSDDGNSWTAVTPLGNNDRWLTVDYVNGYFVALAGCSLTPGDCLMTSTDGINWTSGSLAGDNDYWYNSAYGNGRIVAVGDECFYTSGQHCIAYADAGFGADTPITLYIDGETEQATTLTYGMNAQSGTSTIGEINLVRDTVQLNYATGTQAIRLDRQEFFNAEDDADILFTATTSTTTINADLVIASETNLVPSRNLVLQGDFINTGTYTAGSNNSVVMSGTSQLISSTLATTTFHNFTKEVTSSDTLTIASTSNVAFTGELTLTGTSGNRLLLRSSTNGEEYFIDPQATTTVAYLDVRDAHNVVGESIVCLTDCVNSGNNSNWSFGDENITITGTLYQADGVTAVGAGRTITAVISTSTPSVHSTTTAADGSYEIQNIPASSPGSWTISGGLGTDPWSDITYGNGLFVAVSNDVGKIMSSPDGVTWTQRSTLGTKAITYGNGIFVGLKDAAGVYEAQYSYDGITWATTSIPATGFEWYDINFNGERFVAVGNGVTIYSINGIDWFEGASSIPIFVAITYGNDRHVATGCGGTFRTRVSTDGGLTWPDTPYFDNGTEPTCGQGIAFGNGVFVAVESGQSYASYSIDGITWATSTISAGVNQWATITFVNGQFIALTNEAATTGLVAYSTDGITWSTSAIGGATADYWKQIAYGQGKLVAIAQCLYGGDDCLATADAGFGSDTAITLYVDGATEKATTLTYGINSNSGTTTMADRDLQTGFVTASNATGSQAVYLDRLEFYDATDDADIGFTATTSSSTINADLQITSGTTLVVPRTLTVTGDFSNGGTFAAGTGDVILSGTSQVLTSTATTTFNNLTKTVTSSDTLTFGSDDRFVFNGVLTLSGTSGNTLSLRSSVGGVQYYLDPATTTLSYLDVQDARNVSGESIICTTSCVDSGNNFNWTFGAVPAMSIDIDTTLGAGTTISLPLRGNADVVIDWGDGSGTTTVTNANQTTNVEHTYASEGQYTIAITGTLDQFGSGFSSYTGAPMITAVSSFGELGLTSLHGAFNTATSLVSVPSTLPTTVSDISMMFYNVGSTFNAGIGGWDTTNVTNMEYLFFGASNFNQNIGGWETGNVTRMNHMFYDAAAFNQNIGGWDTGSTTYMDYMFVAASTFNQNIGGWNTSAVVTMQSMFFIASAFNQNISQWNTASVTNMTSMFQNATSFNQDLSDWCVSLIGSEPSSFDTGASSWTGDPDTRPQWGTCPDPNPLSGATEITISGTLYQNNGTTPIGSGRTITAAIGTSTVSFHSTTTDASSNFSITGLATSTLHAIASTSAAGNDDAWYGVTYGNGLFVAVAQCQFGGPSNTCIITSPDGVTWTPRSVSPSDPGFNPAFYDVTFGEGLFVAVARTNTDDTVWYSSDGITWSIGTGGFSDWNSVTYGEGRFVAVGDSGGIAYSDNGTSWTTVTALGNDDPWTAVTYGNGRFVAVAACEFFGDCVMHSDDGVTWSTTTIAGNNDNWRSVAYGNGRFVAVANGGSGGADTAYSTDGITWTTSTDAVEAWAVSYVNGRFVAAGFNTTAATSLDGDTWATQPILGGNDAWRDIAAGNGTIVFVGTDGVDRVAYADAGIGPDTPITLYVDDETENATALTYGIDRLNAELTIDVDLRQNAVTLKHATGTQEIDLRDGWNLDSALDADILLTSEVLSATVAADLLIDNSTTVYLPMQLTVQNDYNNQGVGIFPAEGSLSLSGAFTQVSGNLTGSSSLPIVKAVSLSDVTFESNASTTRIEVASGASLTAPAALSVGDFVQNGSFDANGGTIYSSGAGYFDMTQARFNASSSLPDGGLTSGFHISPDELHVYQVLSYSNDGEIKWYELTSPGDISSLGASSGSLLLPNVYDFTMSPNGLDLYAVYRSSINHVGQYALTTPWDITTATFVASTTLAELPADEAWDISFSPDGRYMQVLDKSYENTFVQYELTTPWDVTTASSTYTGLEYELADIVFSPDGTLMQTVNVFGRVKPYTLSTPWDITTAVSPLGGSAGYNILEQGSAIYITGAGFNAAYDTAYIISNEGPMLLKYDLPAIWSGDLVGTNNLNHVDAVDGYTVFMASASTTDLTIATSAEVTTPTSTLSIAGSLNVQGELDSRTQQSSIYFTGSGETISGNFTGASALPKTIVTGSYTLSNAASTSALTVASGGSLSAPNATLTIEGDYTNNGTFTANSGTVVVESAVPSIANLTTVGALDITAVGENPTGVAVSDDGTQLYVLERDSESVTAYDLTVPYIATSATSPNTVSLASVLSEPEHLVFADGGTKLFIVNRTFPDYVASYSLSTPWDIDTLSFVATTSADGSIRALFFNKDGTKMYTTFPNAATTGQYTLTTPWDLSTRVASSKRMAQGDNLGVVTSAVISPDGTRIIYLDSAGDGSLYEVRLDVPYEIGSMDIGLTTPLGTENPRNTVSISLSADGRYLYLADFNEFDAGGDFDYVRQYQLSDDTTLSGSMTGSSAFNNLTQDTLLPMQFTAAASTTGTYTITPSSVYTGATTTVFNADSTYTFENIDWAGASSTEELLLRSSASGTPWYLDVPGSQLSVEYVNVQDSYAPLTTGGIIADTSTNAGNNCNWDFGAGLVGECAGPVEPPLVGSSTIANHSAGQVTNLFSYQNVTDGELFGFRLTPNSGAATTTNLVFTLAGTRAINPADFSNLRVYRDNNSNRIYDSGTDTLVANGGIISVVGQSGTITFTDDFIISAAADYLLVGDWTYPASGSQLTVHLYPEHVTIVGAGSAGAITYTRSSLYSAEGETTTSFAVDIGAASEDRIVLVAIGGEPGSTTTVSSSNIAGVSGMVLDHTVFMSVFEDRVAATLVAAQVPTGSGSQTVSVTFSGTQFNVVGQAWVIRGADWPAFQVNSDSDLPDPASLSLTSPENGAAFALTYNFGTTVQSLNFGATNATTNSQTGFYNGHIGNFADATDLPAGSAALTEDGSTGFTVANAAVFEPAASAGGTQEVIGSVSSIQHSRVNRGGGGSSAAVGAAAPVGDGDVGGGTLGGGGAIDTNTGGGTIGVEDGFYAPTVSANVGGAPNWGNRGNAVESDGSYASADASGADVDYTSYNHGVPDTDVIVGIEVKLELAATQAGGTVDVELSWNGGSNFTAAKVTPVLTTTDTVIRLGGAADTWGRSWSPTEVTNPNFVVRLTSSNEANVIFLDAMRVRVYHQAGGGGGGGGGAI